MDAHNIVNFSLRVISFMHKILYSNIIHGRRIHDDIEDNLVRRFD